MLLLVDSVAAEIHGMFFYPKIPPLGIVFYYIYIWLVVWLPFFIFPLILGISSSQLTKSYFSEGWPNHQPAISIYSMCISNLFLMDSSVPPADHKLPQIPRESLISPFWHGQSWVFLGWNLAPLHIKIIWLVVWNIFYFPIYWVSNHPNWRNRIFQRGGPTTNQSFFLDLFGVLKSRKKAMFASEIPFWFSLDPWAFCWWNTFFLAKF